MAAELGTRCPLVASNKGAPGVDGESSRIGCRACSTVAGADLHQALIEGAYIPETSADLDTQARGWRKRFSISMSDRIVQQAVLQVLEPIFEPSFHNSSSQGFSPSSRCTDCDRRKLGYFLQSYGTLGRY
ncbi:MAG: hypothetical protein KF752_09355 [Pirellulaceae bacterium]|nr:hypothetical protein [Pirellulaceae bacterium]